MEVLGILTAIAGCIGGLLVAVQTDDTGRSFGEDEHPYVAAGIGMAVGSIVLGFMLTFVGYWAAAWVEANWRSAVPVPGRSTVPTWQRPNQR